MITAGQIYEAVRTDRAFTSLRRIRVVSEPSRFNGVYGYGKVMVETVLPDGRGVRRRRIELSQLHESATTKTGEPRRNGYVLVQDVTPCSLTGPHLPHRAWTTPDVGVCPGIPTTTEES